jgi:hypothetical protein
LWLVPPPAAGQEVPAKFRPVFNYPLGEASVATTEQIAVEDPRFEGAKLEMVALVTSAGIVLFKVDGVDEVVFDLPTNEQSELLRGQLVIPELDVDAKVFRTIDIADDDAPDQIVVLSSASPGTGRDCSRGGQQCRQGNAP